MGFRFRKSIKIAPGIRLNLNKKSVGLRIGGKGAGVSFNSKGRVTKTVGVPGTGLYYTDTSQIGGNKGKKKSSKKTSGSTQLAYKPQPNAVQRVAPQGIPPKQKKPLDKKTIIIASAIVIWSFVFCAIVAMFLPDVETASTTEVTTVTTTEATTEAETWWSVPAFAITQSPTEAEPQTEEPTQAPTQRATQAAANTTRTQQAAQPTQETTYMLNENTGKYHRSDCRTIRNSENLREISAEEAENYSPCGVCKP